MATTRSARLRRACDRREPDGDDPLLGDEVGYGVEHAAAQRLVGQFPKPAFDQVEPRRGGRGEVQLESGVFVEPGPHALVLVSGVVVADQVYPKFVGDRLVDGAQELQELGMAMPGQALPDDFAGQHVQRREQRGGAVALVVVGHCGRPPFLDGQRRLGAVQCLHGGLLVHTQHDRLLRRIEVQTDHVDQFLVELRVVGQLECLDQVRFEPARGPHPLHRRRGHPSLGGHRPARPVGLAVRRGIPCQVHDLIDLLLRDRGFAAAPGPDLAQLRQALLGEPGPPRPNRYRLHPYLRGDPRVRHTIGRQQQRLGPLNLPMRRGLRPRQGLQRFSLTVRHDQGSRWCHHLRSLSQTSPLFWRHTTS